MAVPGSPLDWEGQTVLDRSGEKIGTIEEIFLVEETNRPEWALVKLGRLKGHTTLVPLTTANVVGKGIKVQVEKARVSAAPEVKPDAEPSEQEVERLYRHYGIPSPASAATAKGNGHGTVSASAPAAVHASGGLTPQGYAPPSTGPQTRAPGSSGGSSDPREQPVSDLLQQVKEEGATLVGQEMRLAKAEMSGKVKDVGIGAGMFGGAGYVANLAAVALMLTIIFALAEVMDPWLAALIVTVLFGAIAAVLALSAKKKIQKAGPPIPEQTVESVKQTIQTVKEEAKWGLGQKR